MTNQKDYTRDERVLRACGYSKIETEISPERDGGGWRSGYDIQTVQWHNSAGVLVVNYDRTFSKGGTRIDRGDILPEPTMQELWEGLNRVCDKDTTIPIYRPFLAADRGVILYSLGGLLPNYGILFVDESGPGPDDYNHYPSFSIEVYGTLCNTIAAALVFALEQGEKEVEKELAETVQYMEEVSAEVAQWPAEKRQMLPKSMGKEVKG